MKLNQFLTLRLFMFCFMLISTGIAQQIKDKTYYFDQAHEFLNYIDDYKELPDGILIAGRIGTYYNSNSVILKINFNGQLIWSTKDTAPLEYNMNGKIEFEAFESHHVYGISIRGDQNSDYHADVWKLNMDNGRFEWSNTYTNIINWGYEVLDYDSNYLICAFQNSDGHKLRVLDKVDGHLEDSTSFDAIYLTLDIEKDINGNVYFLTDNELTKFSGRQWDQEIWNRSYSHLDVELGKLHELYIDKYDEVYLFGESDFSSSYRSVIIKVNTHTGFSLWAKRLYGIHNNWLKSFIDDADKLYTTYQNEINGNGSFNLKVLDKQTGQIEQDTIYSIEVLGDPNGLSNGASAFSLDKDCNGDIYFTGYYGGGNNGPGAWGILKVDGNSYNKLYDLTITKDSLNVDGSSIGLGCLIVDDVPIFLGHQDSSQSETPEAHMVSIDPTDGQIEMKIHISGENLEKSLVKELIRDEHNTYTFIQEGAFLTIEKYNKFENIIWENTVSNSYFNAGQMETDIDYMFATMYNLNRDSIAVNNNNESLNWMLIKQIDLFSGDVEFTDSIPFNGQKGFSYEIEVDQDEAYIFFTRNDSNYCARWKEDTIDSIVFLELSSDQLLYQGRKDLVLEKDANTYLTLGSQNVYSLNKADMTLTNTWNYPTDRTYYYGKIQGDSLFMVGHDVNNMSIVTCLNINGMTVLWEEMYEQNESLYNLQIDTTNHIFVTGLQNNALVIREIVPQNGSSVWEYVSNPILGSKSIPHDFIYNKHQNKLVVTGTKDYLNGYSNLFISTVSIQGDLLFDYEENNGLEGRNYGNAIAVVNDSITWVGGQIHTISKPKSGVIYSIVDTLIEDNTSNISQVEYGSNKHNVFVYPNPTSKVLHIDGVERFDYIIHDNIGRLIVWYFYLCW